MNEQNKAVDQDIPGNTASPSNESSENEVNNDQQDNANPVTDQDQPEVTDASVQQVPVSEEQFMESDTPAPADENADEEDHESEDYSGYSREELVALLEKYVDEVEVPRFKARIGTIREFLSQSFAQEHDDALAKFIEEGGNRDDFKPATDPLEERYHQAIRKFGKKRTEYQEKQEKQRQQNLNEKNEILTQLKDLIQNEDNMNKAFDRFHELQAKWRSTGPVPSADVKHLQMNYKFLIDKFYDFIKINRELQDLDQRRNLEAKLSLCEQAEMLLLEPSLNTALRKLHQLQDKWRETGPVPRDKKNEIWDRFKLTCDKLFEKRKEFLASADAARAKNLEEKTKLCEVAEAIKTEEGWKHKDWQECTRQFNELQSKWKTIGPADKKVNDQIWNRFKTACDNFFKAKNDFYHKRKQEFAANLQTKTELCIQAEALKESTDWKTTTAELIRLQQEWKKSGPVGEKHSEKIWKRFRIACDAFFANKSNHFSSRDKEQEENLEKKLALIDEIEKYESGADNTVTFEELKNFQRRWSELGMIPLNKKEEITSRYKKVIDAHFDKVKLTSSERQRMRNQYRPEPSRLNTSAGKPDSERRMLQNKIAELKNEVQVWENNIGFFAKSKNADKLKSEFEEKINKAKEEINELKGRLDLVKDS